MNKLKIKGLGNLLIPEPIEEGHDYIVVLRTAADGIFTPSKNGDDFAEPVYHLKTIQVEQLQKFGSSDIIKPKNTSKRSVALRMAIMDWGQRLGKPDDQLEDFYNTKISELIEKVNQKDI